MQHDKIKITPKFIEIPVPKFLIKTYDLEKHYEVLFACLTVEIASSKRWRILRRNG